MKKKYRICHCDVCLGKFWETRNYCVKSFSLLRLVVYLLPAPTITVSQEQRKNCWVKVIHLVWFSQGLLFTLSVTKIWRWKQPQFIIEASLLIQSLNVDVWRQLAGKRKGLVCCEEVIACFICYLLACHIGIQRAITFLQMNTGMTA